VSAAPRILIVKPSSLGDVVHALPTVARIRRRFPDAHIAWVVNESLASLLQHSPVINELVPFHRQQLSKFPSLLKQLRAGKFNIVVDLQGLLRSGIMTFATRALRRIGLSDAREGSRMFYNEIVTVPRVHAVDRYLKTAEYLGCTDAAVEFPLGVADAPREGWIAINPSARWETKLWGVERYRALAERLPRERVVFTGSASEAVWINRLSEGFTSKAGQTDLLELAEFYSRCSVVITNDSGPMHIAAAVGTPVVAIFGPTDPMLTGPYGKQHVVLRAGVHCSPCLKDRCSHQPLMECMEKITVEQVVTEIQRYL